MADFVVAVRTYKRHQTFLKRTYKVLAENQLLDRLYIFVASEEERVLYAAALSGCEYKELIVGVPGGAAVSNFIVNYFPEGTPIVFADDDLYRFFTFSQDGKYNKVAYNLKDYIVNGFQTTQLLETNGFTFSFLSNKFYLKGKPFAEFRPFFLAGNFYGAFNDKEMLTIPTDFSHYDDSLRTFKILNKYKGILVFWWGGFETYYGKEAGGLQASGERNNVKDICDKYDTPEFRQWMTLKEKAGLLTWQLKPKNRLPGSFISRKFSWEDFASL